MIELPEAIILGKQIKEKLTDRTISGVFNATNKHRFTFFNGDPSLYPNLLIGKKILTAQGYGAFVNIIMTDGCKMSIADGVIMVYNEAKDKMPKKYQLLLTFDDNSFLTFTVTLYGMIYAYKGNLDNKYLQTSLDTVSPLSNDFDMTYFNNLLSKETKDISAKAFLATEQRVPGIGNGVLQDILFNARIKPKREISTFSNDDRANLYKSIKTTLSDMTEKGGRDTEMDLFGHKGGYKTILSKNTYEYPCPRCQGKIIKENYMGGVIYYCPNCQI